MSVVKKTLKALLKTITNPVGQANDEHDKDKKFWTQDLKKKNESFELDESSAIVTKQNSDGSYDDVGMNNRRVLHGSLNKIKTDARSLFGKNHRLELFHGDRIDGEPHTTLHISESVELVEAKVDKSKYKAAAKLAAEMTAYANSLKHDDEKATDAHLKAIDAQWAAYQAALDIGHKDRLTHLSIGNKHLDKTGLHDLDEDSQSVGTVTAHVNEVHELMKAENAKKNKPESRGAVLNRTNQALKSAHGHNAPQITRLRDDDDTPANVSTGKLSHHTPEQVMMRHYGQSTGESTTHSSDSTHTTKTNEGINMSLTPVRRKIRSIIESFVSREDEVNEINYAVGSKEFEKKHNLKSNSIGTKDAAGDTITNAKYDNTKKDYVHYTSKGPAKIKESEELDEAFDGTHVIIEKPGHSMHGKKAAVFHHHADGSVNAQVRTGRGIKDNEIHNFTLKPNEYKTINEEVELDEWDAKEMIKAATKPNPKVSRTITKFKPPGSKGVEVTQVRHGDEADVKYDEEGNPIDAKTDEPVVKKGRGRPAGSKSGARTHGAEGGIANKAIYGGHQYNMPQFSPTRYSK